MLSGAREAAFEALGAFRRSGAWPQDALDAAIRKHGLDERDAGLSQRICRGVLRNRAFLDWHIDRLCGKKLEPALRDILELSAYQILFLDRIPVHAAVSEGVELTKKHVNPSAARLTNAILRKLALQKGCLPEIRCDTPEETLSVRYSHPLWFVEEMSLRLGVEECEALLRADNEEPPLTLEVNTLRTDAEEMLRELAPMGAQIHPWCPDALVLTGQGSVGKLKPLADGLMWVQDAAARTAVRAIGLKPGDTVLDVCAAPGGKSFAAAIEMENRGDVRSFDISVKKLKRIETGAETLGIGIIRTAPMDASKCAPSLCGIADAVIADVPCSGFGTLRKSPDVRYKTRSSVETLGRIQYGILKNTASYVKRGGVLLYSTCSVRRAENEEIVEKFLRETPEFSLEAFSVPGMDSESGMATFWPHRNGTDGFFLAKLRRNK